MSRFAFVALISLAFLMGCSNNPVEPRNIIYKEKSDEQSDIQEVARLVPGSGTYARKISTQSISAQKFFNQGLRFAWGFYFPESIASYQQASLYDPAHPMPYWGLAHAMGPNPNSRYAQMPDDPKGEGLKAIRNALSRIDNATPLESEMIKALYVLYDKESIPNNKKRDSAYLKVMRKLNKTYPDDSDIAALYAASYMSIRRWDYWDAEGNPKDETIPVAEALEHVMENDMTNPGVLHLHIHLIEASMEPERALLSANTLEQTAPIAGHVVHMPAHIYVRVGEFQRAIDNNVRSQEVDEKFKEIWGDLPLPNLGTYPLSHRMHAGHAIDFIRYAATVQGNYGVAIEAALASKEKSLSYNNVHRYQKSIAAPWLVHKIFGQWDNIIDHTPSHSGMPYLDGIWAYASGSALLSTGDMDGAARALARLQEIAWAPDADEYRAGPTPVSCILKLAALGLNGEMLEAEGDLPGAIQSFREAVALEDLNNYTEPPDWAQPIRHYLGAALMKNGQFMEAEKVYRRDLKWNHKNGWSLHGLQASLKAQGRGAEAQVVQTQFETAWQHADIVLTESHL
ncbi:MAG: tetratricopeptide (TPR) repeat protein [Candidatus Azotimanducaceae bacterium]|jgi:tetratricopeptide (TPR) repeat protein